MTAFAVACLFAASSGMAATLTATAETPQQPKSRITAAVDDSRRVSVHGMSPAQVIKDHDLGAVDPSMPLGGITLVFSPTPEQKADMDALAAAQLDIQSPLYHQWLTPEQFGTRFGMSSDDIAKVSAWLRQKGFTVDRVARASNFIVFSGTAGLVESAFGAPIHNFKLADGSVHFAPANDLTFPAAIAPTVGFVRGLNSFRHRPRFKKSKGIHRDRGLHPSFTDVNNTETPYLLDSEDLETLYDINAAYNAGFTGAGQSIAVLGQSYILPSDIANYQGLVGATTAKAPIFVLVPNSGTSARMPGDEGESDLDVEYSSTIAKGAQVYFVYTGSNVNNGTDDANALAVDDRIAPVITVSYGDCELDDDDYYDGTSYFTAQDAIFEQGSVQGQSLMNAAGDDGAVDCIENTNDGYITVATGQAPAVDYPGSSPWQTTVGGTGFPQADFGTGANVSTYWNTNAKGAAPLVNSLKSYVPEVVWNDDDPYFGTSSGGGGTSLYETGPTWQAPGIVIGGVAIPTVPTITVSRKAVTPRLVPDVALMASNESPGMLVCSSDPDSLEPGQVYSCTSTSFYDPVSGDLTVFGGTSFGGPIMSGITAILNQALNADGLGLLNPALYSIAESATKYPLAFHDITVGSNSCYDYTFNDADFGITGYPPPPAPMPLVCGVTSAAAGPSPPAEWSALTGYDMASGLGSLDVYNLIKAWPTVASASLIGTTTTLSAKTTTPIVGNSDPITVTLASSTGTTVPTGTLTLLVDGTTQTAGAPYTLSNGVYTFTFADPVTTTLGTHVIVATYSGDTTHAASTGTVVLTAQPTSGTISGSFTIAAGAISIPAGSTSGTANITITPVSGYTGTVNLTVTASPTLPNGCYVLAASPASVTSSTAVTDAITVYTTANACNINSGLPLLKRGGTTRASAEGKLPGSPAPHKSPWKQAPLPAALAGLVFVCCTRRRNRAIRSLALVVFAVAASAAGIGLSGCSSSSGNQTPVSAPQPVTTTYTVTVTGTDSIYPTTTATTSFTLSVTTD